MNWQLVKPVLLDELPGDLCRLKYPNHPKGCPNYGKKVCCPPRAKHLSLLIKSSPIYIIWNVFLFGRHVQKMKLKHPEWSERQARCCLYWQGKARKQLVEEVKNFLLVHPDMYIVSCPEASGVNVTKTMASIDKILEWPPETIAYQVVLAGERRIKDYRRTLMGGRW